MTPTFWMAVQHLRTRWKQTFASISSVAVGVMILTTALSLTNGFESDMIDKILGTTPHISLKPGISDHIEQADKIQEQLKRFKGIEGTLPIFKEQALISNPLHTTGTLLFGTPPEGAQKYMASYLTQGKFLIKDTPSAVVGTELSKKLQLFMGDKVTLMTTKGNAEFQVTGFFQSGLYELDARIVILPLDQAQVLFQVENGINEISVKLKDVFQAQELAREMQTTFPTLYIRTWMDTNRSLLNAMALEKKVIFLVVLFIIVVAMIGIANTLILIVMEKTVDIAILRALGSSKGQISRIFMFQGLLIGSLGVLLGSGLGVLTSLYLSVFPVRIPGDVYDLDHLPVEMHSQDFLLVAGATLVICLIASVFPARRAVKSDPIQTLRRNI